MPPAVAAGALAALEIVQREPERRARLQQLIDYFRERVAELHLPLSHSTTAIQPLIIGCEIAVQKIAADLQARGFLVGAIRPPTVPVGSARLRITLCASHSETQIDGLLGALTESLAATKIEIEMAP
jgi:8-amino-7-oxononanoate synthase